MVVSPAVDAPALRVRGVSQRFGSRTIYRDVSCEVARGEVFVILGGSGCGKSTLLRQIVGLLPPGAGSIEVLGRDMYADPGDTLRRVGVMFQSGALFGSMTLLENVMLPLELYTGLPGRPPDLGPTQLDRRCCISGALANWPTRLEMYSKIRRDTSGSARPAKSVKSSRAWDAKSLFLVLLAATNM